MRVHAEEMARLECELDAVERLVSDACGRAADLERVIGVMLAMGGDISFADRALMATYESLGLLTSRRARLFTMVESWRNDRDGDESSGR